MADDQRVEQIDLAPHLEKVDTEGINYKTLTEAAEVLVIASKISQSVNEVIDQAELLPAAEVASNHLQNLHPVIAFLTTEKDPNTAYQKIDFENVQPSIKDLNDKWLGPKGTDTYIKQLKEIVYEEFTVDNEKPHIMGQPFKGASILARNNLEHQVIKEKVKNIQKKAAIVLRKLIRQAGGHTEEAIQKIEVRVNFGVKPLENKGYIAMLNDPESAEKLFLLMQDSTRALQLSKLSQRYGRLIADRRRKDDRRQIEGSAPDTERRSAPRREENTRRDVDPAPVWDLHIERLNDPNYVFSTLQSEYNTFRNTVADTIEGGKLQIKEQWERFVEVRTVEGRDYVELKPDTVYRHRKDELEPLFHDRSDDYEALIRYLYAVDIIDTVEPYIHGKNFEVFTGKVREIVNFLSENKNLADLDDAQLKTFITKAKGFLSTSLKDLGVERQSFGTAYTLLESFMDQTPEPKLFSISDVIGFGVINTIHRSRQVAEISNNYTKGNVASEKKCLTILARSNEEGTKVLVDRKQKAAQEFQKKFGPTVDSHDGGDEYATVSRVAEGFNEAALEASRVAIETIAKQTHLRIVSVLLPDFHIDPKDIPKGIKTLLALYHWAEERINKLKQKEITDSLSLPVDTPSPASVSLGTWNQSQKASSA